MASSSSGHGYLGSELPASSADSQRPTADQPDVRQDLSSDTVFRLHILGKHDWDKSQINEARVEQLVRKAFDVTPDAKIIVKSLADHPVRQALVATLNFSQIPTKISQSSLSAQDFDETVEGLSLDLDTHFHGFTPLHSKTSSEYTCDIVALSGLGGHAFGSFKSRGRDFMWLRDDLPFSMPDARVFVYGYDTGLQNSCSFQSLEDLGLSFKDALRSLLKGDSTSGFPKPLVLLGHSLGGLVVKEALCKMSANPKGDDGILLRSIRAVLFFGTPNQGMDITSLIPMVEGQANEEFLRSLGTDSADLRRQAQQWLKAFDSAKPTLVSNNLEITSYYETCTSRTAVKLDGKWKMSGPPARLVDRFSATHGRAWERDERFVQPIDRDHSGLVKFRGRNDPIFVNHVLPRLQSYLKPMSTPSERNPQEPNLTDEQKACLSALDFPDRTSRQDQIMTPRDNTCEWLLKHQTYRLWLQGGKGLLWLEGHPGTGKSTLTKHATHATKTHSSRHFVFSHFFYGRGSAMQKSALGLLRSLTYQLLKSFSICWTEIMTKYEETKSRPTWSLEWLGSFLNIQLRQACATQLIILFIDALDECEEEDRDYLGGFLTDVVHGPVGANLKVFVSCRHYPNLFSEGFRINTELNNADDISVFVSSKLQIMQKKKRSVLAKEIINNARGNFQWSKIVTMESVKLHRKGHTAAYIRKTIQKLPKDIYELYDSLFKDADPDDLRLAHRLFHWLCFAKRPLSVRELQYIIMLSPDTKERSIEELCHRTDFREELRDMANTITEISRGLAEAPVLDNFFLATTFDFFEAQFSENRIERDEVPLSHVWTSPVQLIHQTVMDYLLDTGLPTPDGNRYKFSRGRSDYFITHSCLSYIMMDEFKDQAKSASLSKSKADETLCGYIMECLEQHILEVDAGGLDQTGFIVGLGWPYNKSGLNNLSSALRKPHFIETFIGGDAPSEKLPWHESDDYNLLYWAVEMGFSGMVKSIVEYQFGQSQASCCLSWPSEEALSFQSNTWRGQPVFLDGYFNINLRDKSGSALGRAVEKRDASVVRELLQSPVIDPNAQDLCGNTPLHNANFCSRFLGQSKHTNKMRPIVKHLLEHPKINPSLRNKNGSVALHSAVNHDDLEILRMYVDACQDSVNVKNFDRETPLSFAARKGFADTVQILISHGNCTRENLQYTYYVLRYKRSSPGLERCRMLLSQTGLVETEDEYFFGSGNRGMFKDDPWIN